MKPSAQWLPLAALLLLLAGPPPAAGLRAPGWLRAAEPEGCKLRTGAGLAAATRLCPSGFVAQVALELEPEFVVVAAGGRESRLPAEPSAEQLLAAGLQPNRYTFVLVHGYLQSADVDWLQRSRELFAGNALAANDNLIVMDWARAASGPYSAVVSRVSAMGAHLAKLVRRLVEELAVVPGKVHLVGHSLGAHVAGFAGKRLQQPQVGRITGLDAAGPCFRAEDKPAGRLAVEDAQQVVLYHYDDLLLGLAGQHGHLDVYVNGGRSQPGCGPSPRRALQALGALLLWREFDLSHTRSTRVASRSLAHTSCQQVAYECQDYASFQRGHCGYCDHQNNQCFLMGFAHQYGYPEAPSSTGGAHLEASGRKLYLSTSDQADLFCVHHYQVLVMFEASEQLVVAASSWRPRLQLFAESGATFKLQLAHKLAPNVFSHLLLVDGALAPVRLIGARLALLDGQGSPREASGLRTPTIEVNFMSNIEPAVRRALSSRLCPSGEIFECPMANFTDCS